MVGTRQRRKALFLLAAGSSASRNVDGFVLKHPRSFGCSSDSRTALGLVPEQGTQLVAASSAMLSSEEGATWAESPQKDTTAQHNFGPTSVARGFISRIFHQKASEAVDEWSPAVEHLPTNQHVGPTSVARAIVTRIFHSKSAETASDKEKATEHEEDHVEYYPVCGFRWVKVGEGEEASYKALSTTINAACSLNLERRKEALVGWYGQACFLGDEVEDDWSYSHGGVTRNEGGFE